MITYIYLPKLKPSVPQDLNQFKRGEVNFTLKQMHGLE